MKGIIGRLFSRQTRLSQAGPADACALAALHAASFHHGWSEDEFERLLSDRNVLAHRATAGERLAGFILSRLVVDEAEILSIAVASMGRGRGLGRQLLEIHLRRRAAFFSRSTRATSRRFDFIAEPVFGKSGGETHTMSWAKPPRRLFFAAICCER